uniref:Uncharacterized protein n=1 Tax=Anguilla anguilla TaxID=7936 RepID=A0A0E9WR69_ANGAN
MLEILLNMCSIFPYASSQNEQLHSSDGSHRHSFGAVQLCRSVHFYSSVFCSIRYTL